MKQHTEKLIPTRKYQASPRLTNDFKFKLKRDIKWLFINRELIEFIETTIKKLPQKDKLPCLYYFKTLAIEVHRTPEPSHYEAFQDTYDDLISAIADEQKHCNPIRWIDLKIEEITALTSLNMINNEFLNDNKAEPSIGFDPELVPEKRVIQMLGMSKSKLLKLRAEGMPYRQIGKPIFYNLKDVKEWLRRDAA